MMLDKVADRIYRSTKFKVLTQVVKRTDGFWHSMIGFGSATIMEETSDGTLISDPNKNYSIVVRERMADIQKALDEEPLTIGGLDLAIPLPNTGKMRL